MVLEQYYWNRSTIEFSKHTSDGTKWVASPAATNSLPFNLAPVKAKNSPTNTSAHVNN